MPTPEQKAYHHWFIKTPASIIVKKHELKQYEFNLWLQEQLPDTERDLQDLKNYFTQSDEYITKMLDRKILIESLKEMLQMLNKKQQDVIYYHFWLGMSFAEIGRLVGVSRDRVRQIADRAISKLKHPTVIRLFNLKDYEHVFEV